MLGRAITLVESAAPDDEEAAAELLAMLAPDAGAAIRLGITGAPGVGKSTFIDAMGKQLTEQDTSVAVLAVDPSSAKSGGSILADKTRMQHLSHAPNALVRPSPAGRHLGGVAPRTRETILVCEAAGFDVIIVETVGVGQSEIEVASLVDFFLLLTLAGAGDDMQTIKRGVFELVDAVAVTKADGGNLAAANRARAQIEQALQLLQPKQPGWSAPVLACSALTGEGVGEVWKAVCGHRAYLDGRDRLHVLRAEQDRQWFRRCVLGQLSERLDRSEAATAAIARLEAEVAARNMTPAAAARVVIDALLHPEQP